nr:DEAD/DEAH box helicase [Acetobacter orientalis]
MTAKTPARPRKTTARSRTKTTVASSDTQVEAVPDVVEAEGLQDESVKAKPVKKTTRTRRAPAKSKTAAAKKAETVAPVDATAEVEVAAEEAAPEAVPKTTKAAPRARKTPVRKTTTRKKAAPAPAEAVVPEAPEETVVIAEAPQEAPAAVALEEVEAAPAPQTPETEATSTETDKPTFKSLELSEPILRAIAEMGYTHPTPIQAQAIPAILMAKDVLGVAQTGTGKTASFTLPMLEILSDSRARARMPRSLILEPTRELALQVAENFVNYGKHLKLTHALLIGGESMADQKEVLNRGVDVLIATPGRLLDLFERGGLLLTQTRILVIDEADRMLDMGFIPDIEKIVSLLPLNRQTLFFSATMAPAIRKLADAFLHAPKEITVNRESSVATTIETGLVVVDEYNKRDTLRRLLRDPSLQNAIVFCNRKRDVDVLTRSLTKHGFAVGALHGDLPQSARFATLEKFKNGALKVLVCSDVAARGIDIGGLSHVFNFDLPFHAEDYVHRIGRTGRAGRKGHAYSLATPYDKALAEAIETLTGKPIPRLELDGLEQLDWTDEKRPPRNNTNQRGRPERPRRDAQHKERTPAKEAPAQDAAPAPVAEERQNTRRPAPQRNNNTTQQKPYRERMRDEAPPMPAGDVLGFGRDIPAFMQLPRRTTILADLPTPTADMSVSDDGSIKHA